MKTVKLNQTIILVDDAGNQLVTLTPSQGKDYNVTLNNQYINFARMVGNSPVCQMNISDFSLELRDSASTGHVLIEPAFAIFETDSFSITLKDGEMTCLNKKTNQFKSYSFV